MNQAAEVASLRFLGHSTVLLEMGAARVLTDPVLRHRVGPIARIVPPHEPEHTAAIDVVVISHAHLDHLDVPTLRALDPDATQIRYIVPPGLGGFFRGEGFARVDELPVGRSIGVGDVTITATRAIHSGYRPPSGPRALAVGYLLDAPDGRVYFAGDTDLFPEMADLAPGLDLALLPVWGWGPRLGPGHMNPERAAIALTMLRPRLAIPIHWGTYWAIGMGRVRRHRRVEPPREFAAMAGELAPDVQIEVVQAGGDPVPIRGPQPEDPAGLPRQTMEAHR